MVKVFTGIHRSGKSTLLKLILQELIADGVLANHIYSINFESMVYANRDIKSIYQEIKKFAANKKGKLYIFLDEIQDHNGWEKMVNSLRVDLDCDLYITGSNSNLLSGEMATYLAGRYIEIPVYTFSFREIMKLKQEKLTTRPKEEEFKDYLRFGGMPRSIRFQPRGHHSSKPYRLLTPRRTAVELNKVGQRDLSLVSHKLRAPILI